MLDLLFGEPFEQARAAALAIVRLRGAEPSEIAIDDGAGQQAGPSELSERGGELFAEGVQRHAETGRE